MLVLLLLNYEDRWIEETIGCEAGGLQDSLYPRLTHWKIELLKVGTQVLGKGNRPLKILGTAAKRVQYVSTC